MKHRFSIIVILFLLGASIATAQENNYKILHPDDVYHEYQSQVYAFIIDVRMKMEFKKKHIEGAINMPKKAMLEIFADTMDLETPLYLYCTTTTRSIGAAEFLISSGFQNITLIDGGFKLWSACELPVTKKNRKKK